MKTRQLSIQAGFTLVEIIVATGIFIAALSAILVLFNYTLKINREVQTVRQVSQGTRNFTEIIAREIRNGTISYPSSGANCLGTNYQQNNNQTLALTTATGDLICFYLNAANGQLMMQKITGLSTTEEAINPVNFTVNPDSFRFVVRPTSNPKEVPYPEIQPMVSIIGEFQVDIGNETMTIPYQTTISSDSYDIPSN